jgi:hypothetical protein
MSELPPKLSDDYFSIAAWPCCEVKSIVLPLPSHLVARAAKIIAVVAYPSDEELLPNASAQKFSDAMLAWMFRAAKARGKIGALPSWVSELKAQQMRGRISRGIQRLHYRLVSYLTIVEAATVAVENDQIADGVIPGFTLRWSEDFSQFSIVLQSHTEKMLPDLWRSARTAVTPDRKAAPEISTIGSLSPSLRASILRHRKAFKAGAGDPNIECQNIYNRHLRTLFPVHHIMSVLYGAVLRIQKNDERAQADPIQMLLRRPEWATNAPNEIAERLPLSIWKLRSLGIPICNCRMVHLTKEDC